ncbi:MAG: hypothetical protein ACRDIY_05250 [Chloroflexota bacterium]
MRGRRCRRFLGIVLLAVLVVACSRVTTSATVPPSTRAVRPIGPELRASILPALPSSQPSGCVTTPIRTDRWPGSIVGLATVPWIQLDPPTAGVTAHLFFGDRPMHAGGKFPDGATIKVLWIVDNPYAANGLVIEGRRLDGDGTFRQDLSSPGSSSSGESDSLRSATQGFPDEFPSIPNVPAPGCWRITIRSGAVHATATLLVVG